MKKIVYVKNGRSYSFGYEPGLEREIVGDVMRRADDPASAWNWLDAATVSRKVARAAAAACRRSTHGDIANRDA